MNGARYAFLEEICQMAKTDESIVIVSDDYSAPVFDSFKVENAKQYISVGIAEQNMVAVSCGLALGGKCAIAYGCAPFPVTRAYDQIKNAAAMMDLPITIVNSGVGFAIPEWGATHYNIEDIALLRTIPNIRIITPTDSVMAIKTAQFTASMQKLLYIRFDKYCGGGIYSSEGIDINRGFSVLRDSNKVAVISCGYCTHALLNSDLDARIIDLYSLPFDGQKLFKAIGELPVITYEEHIAGGGIGSAVLEAANTVGIKNPIKRMAVNFQWGYPHTSGSREYFLELYGLTLNDIREEINKCRR